MKLTLHSLLVATSLLLVPVSSFAHGPQRPPPAAVGSGATVHEADAPWARRQASPRRGGHYELRTLRRWIPGHHVQVWVPRRHWRGGHYVAQWVPGAYQAQQEWVWIPARPGGRFLISANF